MNPDEFKALLSKIAENRDNQALVTELLTKAGDSFNDLHTNHATLTTAKGETDKQIAELQKTNMNLFLRVQNPEPINPAAVNSDKPMTYDDLLTNWEGTK